MNKLIHLFLSIFILLTASCSRTDDDSCEGVLCTLEFKIINVKITNQNNEPLALDSFKVVNLENNKYITPSQIVSADTGTYPLITDGVMENKQSLRIRFNGFLNDSIAVTDDYTAHSNCCGLESVEGNLNLTIR